jgi:glycosyltransferase involved in cell wall biosynthesis
MHNVLYMLEQRKLDLRLRKEGNRKRPSISGWRLVQQVRSLERRILCSYSRVIAVSADDVLALQRLVSRPIDVIPNGVDLDYFGNVSPLPRETENTVVYTGHMRYIANIDAMQYFVQEIWPLIRQEQPTSKLLIVGGDPAPEVWDLQQHPGVTVVGAVPDVRPYLAASTVAIVPLRLGAGTRLKILEALAAGRPVVSTTVGAEGLDLLPEHDLLLADTPATFAAAVLELFARPQTAQTLAAQGQATVRDRYSWSHIAATFSSLLRESLAAHARRPAR